MRIFGLEMPARSVDVRHRLGYMPEREVSSPKVSAVAFLTYCGRIFGISRVDALERAHEVLNYVKMGDSRYRTMETYSTGMLQRVKLAQAILHDQSCCCWMATNGLDPDGRIEILDLTEGYCHASRCYSNRFLHLLPDVQHVCEEVIMIDKGKVKHSGKIKDLTAPRLEYCEIRLRDSDQVFVEAVRNRGSECVRLHPSNTWLVRLPEGGAQVLFQIARDCQTQIRHFQPARRSLEEAFLQAVDKE